VRLFLLFVLISILWVLLYRFVPPPLTATMAGDLLAWRGAARDWTPLERIDRDMVRAAIAAEDSKFCAHEGFDQDAIAAAMRRNAAGTGTLRGGSTISQQTAKNAFLWQGGGYVRKGFEAWFTLLVENLWGKRRIMEVYLNLAETGIGTYGVEAGARRYFGHGSGTMSRIEAARLAAILPLPKKRLASAPRGFTRRYGNAITARIGVVARDGLDACVYETGSAAPDTPEPTPSRPSPKRKAALPPLTPLPGDEPEAVQEQPVNEPEPSPVPEPIEAPVDEPAPPEEPPV